MEVYGNRAANYIKFGTFGPDDNRIFLEIGDCCVITFRGILTVEMLSNFLTNTYLGSGKSLIDCIKEKMSWDDVVNKQFSVGATEFNLY